MLTAHPRRSPGLNGLLLSLSLVSLSFWGLGCPKTVPGFEDRDVKVRRVSEPVEDLSETQRKQQEALRRASAKRKVETMRMAFVRDVEKTCERDDECTLVTEHCCSCEYRGRLTGINRTNVPLLAQRRTTICKDVRCTAQVSDDPSCNATKAVCREGVCVADIAAGAGAPEGIGVEPIPAEDEGAEDEGAEDEGADDGEE